MGGFFIWENVLDFIALGLLLLVASADKPDPRCDTSARYDAMREGANCFSPPYHPHIKRRIPHK